MSCPFCQRISCDNCTYTKLSQWVVDIMEVHVDVQFDCMLPNPSKAFIATLKRCSSNSKPGVNGVSYFHLQRLPCTHLFLALLYSTVLLHSYTAPLTWCIVKITPIHKDGPNSKPGNFQPIALTSTIGRMYHNILASHPESYLRQNSTIDTSTQ